MGRWTAGAAAGCVVALALLVGACTDDAAWIPGGVDDTSGAAVDGAPPESEADFSAWFSKAAEVTQICSENSAVVGDAVDEGSLAVPSDELLLSTMTTAGQAIEFCRFVLDDSTPLPNYDELDELWPAGTELLDRWLDAMAETNRSILVVLAGNLDSRPLGTEMIQDEFDADELATELDARVASAADDLGLDVEDGFGLGLYEWDPHLD